MHRIELDTAVPFGPLTSFSWCQLTGDLAICTLNGIYILESIGTKVVRKFYPLKTRLRALAWCPGVVKGFGAALASISADGKTVYLFDPLQGCLKSIFESSQRITALVWNNASNLSLGTSEGEQIQFNLETGKTVSRQKLSEKAILFMSDSGILDGYGRFFYQGKLILDDGILQPCALYEQDHFIFFVKWKNVYRFEKESGNFNRWTLEEANSVFLHATMVNFSLVCITDSKEKFILSHEGLKRFSLVTDGTASPMPVSDDEDANENEAESLILEREKVFGVCSRRGQLAAIFGAANNKSAWIELFEFATEELESSPPLLNNSFANVSCPLCPDSSMQRVSTTASACSRGHPISICSESLTRIDAPNFYRCRRCNRCFKTRLDSCKICGFFLSKNK